jgi:hypothetical protein
MNFSKRLWRSLLFIMLISALCGGLAMPLLAPARAAPQMQATATSCVGTPIAQWTFTGDVTTPSAGSGIFSFGSGLTNETFIQGASATATDRAVRYSSWTASTSLDTADYVEFIVSTVGMNAIGFSFDYRSTGSGPAGLELRYFDGTSFVPFGNPTTLLRDSAFHTLPFDLSTITVLDNNPNATFRLYGYSAIGGNLAFDNVTIIDCLSSIELTGTAVSSNETGTASNLTGTAAAVNQTGTAANLTGTAAAVNQTGTVAANQTGSAMPTSSPTITSTPVGFLSVIINEIAWAGTAASSSDEWIELWNPGSSPVNLAGWTLRGVDGTPTIGLTGSIPAGGFYLLERTDDTVVSDIAADQFYTGDLGNFGEILHLLDSSNRLVDTANGNGGAWPGNPVASNTQGSLERRGQIQDSETAWITNVGFPTAVVWGLDAQGGRIKGTPKHPNWAVSVTPTASPIPSRTRTPLPPPTQTRAPTVAPQPLVAINEFVPRPGQDWNNDGVVNVGDEYVEIINHGIIPVSLSGYSLDDEVNIGSNPYRLPAITISPGERVVFYGSETALLLSDGGDGVRLLSPNGQLKDAYNYRVVRFPDQSFCRLPDNGGLDDWNTNCFPTPGLQNALSGSFVSPPNVVDADLLCPIADTLPLDFILAECPPFGNNIWRAAYWDDEGWYGEKNLPRSPGKWPVFAD